MKRKGAQVVAGKSLSALIFDKEGVSETGRTACNFLYSPVFAESFRRFQLFGLVPVSLQPSFLGDKANITRCD